MRSTTEQIDQIFAAWDRGDSPGCALAILRHGEILYARGYGLANLEYAIPITPATIFHVASISKQFTAMAVALLAQQGKLALDDDVRRYLPELHDFGSPITIRQLIHHTSGLRDQWDLLVMAGWRMDDVITTDDILHMLWRQRELNFAPGAEYCYCNSGYTLLALLVERVSGSSFRAFCAERIFAPLGMHSSHIHDDHTEIVPQRAYSYVERDGIFRHAVLSYANSGATSLFTTVEDLARWDEQFYTAQLGGQRLVEQMHAHGVLNDGEPISYAFGLQTERYRGLRVVAHSGGDAGFRAHYARFPDQHFSVILLGNLATLNAWKLARQVADICLADAFAEGTLGIGERQGGDPRSLPAEQLEDKAGVYFHAASAQLRRLELHDGSLHVTIGPRSRLIPLDEQTFQLAAAPQISYLFRAAQTGAPAELHERVGAARPLRYERVTLAAPAPPELAHYAGSYMSDELDTVYEVRLLKDRLEVQPRRHSPICLWPLLADAFASDHGHVLRFSRAATGSLDGFTLSSERVRHLRFHRIG